MAQWRRSMTAANPTICEIPGGHRPPLQWFFDPVQMRMRANENRSVRDRNRGKHRAFQDVRCQPAKFLSRCEDCGDSFLALEVNSAVGKYWRRRVVSAQPLLPVYLPGGRFNTGGYSDIAHD